jgi:hypothetical protein
MPQACRPVRGRPTVLRLTTIASPSFQELSNGGGNRGSSAGSSRHSSRAPSYTPIVATARPLKRGSMSNSSEERLPQATSATPADAPPSARILAFERPRSELQRAIQERAQDAIARDQERDREVRRPQPLRTLIILVIATIPVLLLFGAVDGFVRAMHSAYERYFSQPVSSSAPAQPVQPAPQASEPGVVLLQSYEAPPATAPAPAEEPPRAPAQ